MKYPIHKFSLKLSSKAKNKLALFVAIGLFVITVSTLSILLYGGYLSTRQDNRGQATTSDGLSQLAPQNASSDDTSQDTNGGVWTFLPEGPDRYLVPNPEYNVWADGISNRGQAVLAKDSDGKTKLFSWHAESMGAPAQTIQSMDIYDFSTQNWQVFNYNTENLTNPSIGSCTYYHKDCPLPAPKGSNFVQYNGKIYAMGYDDTRGAYIPNGVGMVSFDIATKKWAREARLGDFRLTQIDTPYFPVGNIELVGEKTNDPKILVFTQLEDYGTSFIEVYEYSIKNNSFSKKTNSSEVRRDYATVKFTNQNDQELIYLVGGWRRDSVTTNPHGCGYTSDPCNLLHIPYYNVTEDKWYESQILLPSEVNFANAGFVYHSLVNYQNKNLVVHSSNITQRVNNQVVFSDKIYVYDFLLGVWQELTSEFIDPVRSGPAVVYDSVTEKMYVYGGISYSDVSWSDKKHWIWNNKFSYLDLSILPAVFSDIQPTIYQEAIAPEPPSSSDVERESSSTIALKTFAKKCFNEVNKEGYNCDIWPWYQGGMAVDRDGYLYIGGAYGVWKINTDGLSVGPNEETGANQSGYGPLIPSNAKQAADFDGAQDVAIGPSGTIYTLWKGILETPLIVGTTNTGAPHTNYVGMYLRKYSNKGELLNSTQVGCQLPQALDIDLAEEFVYVGCTGQDKNPGTFIPPLGGYVHKFSATDLSKVDSWGNPDPSSLNSDATSNQPSLFSQLGAREIQVACNGNILVDDTGYDQLGNSRVMEFTPAGQYVSSYSFPPRPAGGSNSGAGINPDEAWYDAGGNAFGVNPPLKFILENPQYAGIWKSEVVDADGTYYRPIRDFSSAAGYTPAKIAVYKNFFSCDSQNDLTRIRIGSSPTPQPTVPVSAPSPLPTVAPTRAAGSLPTQAPPAVPESVNPNCVVSGCYNEICSDQVTNVTCDEYQPRFRCLEQYATCQKIDGQCRWLYLQGYGQCLDGINQPLPTPTSYSISVPTLTTQPAPASPPVASPQDIESFIRLLSNRNIFELFLEFLRSRLRE